MTQLRPTREEAIAAAGKAIAVGYHLLDTLPISEAARRAFTVGGPSVEELETRIRARRVAAGIPVPPLADEAAAS